MVVMYIQYQQQGRCSQESQINPLVVCNGCGDQHAKFFTRSSLCVSWPAGSLLCSWMNHLTSSSPPSSPGGSPPSCDSLSREVWQVANMTSCVQVLVANCMVLLLVSFFSFVDILSEVIIYFMYQLYSINNGWSMGCHFL